MAFDSETGREAGKKGKRGKDTQIKELREAFLNIVADNSSNIQKWLEEVANKEPAKAIELLIKLSSFVIAKPKNYEGTENKDKVDKITIELVDSWLTKDNLLQ